MKIQLAIATAVFLTAGISDANAVPVTLNMLGLEKSWVDNELELRNDSNLSFYS
jgi:hypothetical protein